MTAPNRPTPAERRAVFAELAEAEADRAERECPLIPGSDAAHALRALVGDDLRRIVMARLEREKRQQNRAESPAA